MIKINNMTASVPAGDTKLGLSAVASTPEVPARGLIIALHGGTYDHHYYCQPGDSFTELAASLGYTVFALDRPGYGSTRKAKPEYLSFAGQTRVLTAAVEHIWNSTPSDKRGAGIVLVGQSIGGMLALYIAAAGSSVPVVGVEVNGVGSLWQAGVKETWSAMVTDDDETELSVPPDVHEEVMYGPAGTYAPQRQKAMTALISALPMPEVRDVVRWAEDHLPVIGPAVEVPVQMTLGQYDNIWRPGAEARDALARHFTATPSLGVMSFPGAGHVIESHKVARSYQLQQLSFVESCLLKSELDHS